MFPYSFISDAFAYSIFTMKKMMMLIFLMLHDFFLNNRAIAFTLLFTSWSGYNITGILLSFISLLKNRRFFRHYYKPLYQNCLHHIFRGLYYMPVLLLIKLHPAERIYNHGIHCSLPFFVI